MSLYIHTRTHSLSHARTHTVINPDARARTHPPYASLSLSHTPDTPSLTHARTHTHSGIGLTHTHARHTHTVCTACLYLSHTHDTHTHTHTQCDRAAAVLPAGVGIKDVARRRRIPPQKGIANTLHPVIFYFLFLFEY